jgi:hypothetical protein
MTDRIRRIHFGAPRGAPALSLRLAAAAVLCACALVATDARALARYVINEPIYEMLEEAKDYRGLCSRPGRAMNHVVTFLSSPTRGYTVYWHPKIDRFVQYPMTSGCKVWKRR